MKIILKELVNGNPEIVWDGVFSPRNAEDKNTILDEAFEIAVCNYIIVRYPDGFGHNSKSCPQSEDGVLMRRYHCSGRNVRITYKEDGMELEDRSKKDRDFILVVNTNEEDGK